MLSLIVKEEYAHGFNLRPDPLGRAFTAARRAMEAAPSNHLAHHALAEWLSLALALLPSTVPLTNHVDAVGTTVTDRPP